MIAREREEDYRVEQMGQAAEDPGERLILKGPDISSLTFRWMGG